MISVKKISKVAVTMVFVGATFALGADEPEYVPGMVIVKFKEVLFNAGKNPL